MIKRRRLGSLLFATGLAGSAVSVPAAQAAGLTYVPELVWAFDKPGGGANPSGGVIVAPDGTIYGSTTEKRDSNGNLLEITGTIFELKPGRWPRILLSFDTDAIDDRGRAPYALTRGPDGTLYGAVQAGRCRNTPVCGGQGFNRLAGTFFKLAPPTGGRTAWTRTTIPGAVVFDTAAIDGDERIHPRVAIASDGSLFAPGMLPEEDAPPCSAGTVFRLRAGNDGWGTIPLKTFMAQNRVTCAGGNPQGAIPVGALAFGDDGEIYGTTKTGGLYNSGTIFEIRPTVVAGQSRWKTRVLKHLGASTGIGPHVGLRRTANGDLFGVAAGGGYFGHGVVYRLRRVAESDRWSFKIIHNFGDRPEDGTKPQGNVLVRANGEIWGTTTSGGACGSGTLYAMTETPRGAGGYTYKVVYSFNCNPDQHYPGRIPVGDLTEFNGYLYGLTSADGGRIYRVKVSESD